MSAKAVMLLAGWAALAAFTAPVHGDDEARARDERWAERAREERWGELQKAIFPGRRLLGGTGVIELEAPARALDAALVPLTVNLLGDKHIQAVYVVIDNNPGPLAARFKFGRAADARTLKMRMRVDTYTNIRAIAEDANGTLYSATKFVKASGGCSAPAGSNDPESLRNIGEMKLKLLNEFAPGESVQAQLMIRHPNFNGMQIDQLTRMSTPPHFIKTIQVSYEGEPVLHVESDISLSTDPVITFGFVPRKEGHLKVEVKDSNEQSYVREFALPAAASVAETI